MLRMEVTFPGQKRVDAHFNGFVVKTDQGPKYGGEGSQPEPFQYFLASLATCAGIYVLAFCQKREIPTAGLKVTQTANWDAEGKKLEEVKIDITLPPGFPEKYQEAVIRAAELCAVKKAIAEPPRFVIGLTP
jgi:ribosomal protein S12 methylthiotransferase accessory factor